MGKPIPNNGEDDKHPQKNKGNPILDLAEGDRALVKKLVSTLPGMVTTLLKPIAELP